MYEIKIKDVYEGFSSLVIIRSSQNSTLIEIN